MPYYFVCLLLFMFFIKGYTICTFGNTFDKNVYYLNISVDQCDNLTESCSHTFKFQCLKYFEWINNPKSYCNDFCCVDVSTNYNDIKFTCQCPKNTIYNASLLITTYNCTNPIPFLNKQSIILLILTFIIPVIFVLLVFSLVRCCRNKDYVQI